MADNSWLSQVVENASKHFDSLEDWEQQAINTEIALFKVEQQDVSEHRCQELEKESA